MYVRFWNVSLKCYSFNVEKKQIQYHLFFSVHLNTFYKKTQNTWTESWISILTGDLDTILNHSIL